MAKSAAVLVLALFSVGDAFSPAAMPRGVMRQSAVSLRCSAMPPSNAIDRRRLGSILAAGALSLALPKQDALAATEAKKRVKPQGPAQALDMIIAMKVETPPPRCTRFTRSTLAPHWGISRFPSPRQ